MPDDLTGLLNGAGSERHPDVADALERMQIEVELALGPAEASDVDDPATHGGRFHVPLGALVAETQP